MKEVGFNAEVIKQADNNTNIALITNCDIPLSVAQYLDVIVPIHNDDVMITDEKQWRTRMLYNACLPFNYSFIIDSHVFPCDKDAPREILQLFAESNVDVSFSNRTNQRRLVMGGAVLSHWSEGSFEFWKHCYLFMIKNNKVDDQGPMRITYQSNWSKKYKYRWLSCNWFFASHGITEKGVFSGPGRCYRSSVIVTGRVRWIHGSLHDCKVMNERTNVPRCYFKSGNCNTIGKGNYAIYSEKQLKHDVSPYKAPALKWEKNSKRNPVSLFW